MEIKTIYHGSVNQIPAPKYGVGKPYNDYGLGFYCTENIEMAKEWACASNQDGYANQYTLDLDGLKVLYLNKKPYHILNWLAISFEALQFVQSVAANKEIYFQNYSKRDNEARDNYKLIASQPVAENEIYVLDIIRNKWTNDEPRLQ